MPETRQNPHAYEEGAQNLCRVCDIHRDAHNPPAEETARPGPLVSTDGGALEARLARLERAFSDRYGPDW